MNDTPTTTRQIVLASRPHGDPAEENFRLEEAELPALEDGQVLVRTTVMSVDPYMRGRMNDAKSYVPPFQIDEPLDGGAVGEVVDSRADDLPVGTMVTHQLGWREHAVVDADQALPVDTADVGDSAYLGVLGMPGLTAYTGLFHIGQFTEGDTVFVSGAAGAVGSLVGQMAKLAGAGRVIGSAGSPEKLERLHELGFDAGINYKDGNLAEQLREAAPDGIDLYFDNVGGDHLEAAIGALNTHGRVTLCGAISQYNATEPPPGPRNMFQAIGKCLTLRGFVMTEYAHLRAEFLQRVQPWLAHGQLDWDVTERTGLENAPAAFGELFTGGNTGKMVVRL
ncbi:NADP-dependent oxidoreductase [Kytococcus sedentarius]|uniref:NADP-dependent oxidoreductase n=1 Tax=Kytococcus sedentarius TaxID=1276 RepID=UPI0035BBE606